MDKYLLLATVQDRIDSVLVTLESAAKFLPDWKVVMVVQEYESEDFTRISYKYNPKIIAIDGRVGPHTAKVAGLELIDSLQKSKYVVCSIDDDMEFVEQTNLTKAVGRCLRPGVGLVSTGWVRAESLLSSRKIVDSFVKQPIVYTGGGLLFNSSVAKLILGMPNKAYFDDNTEWSLYLYIRGFVNYRYRGSLTIHRICGKGGRRAWIKDDPSVIPDTRYIKMHPSKMEAEKYLIGVSKDLTKEAHNLHKANREARS
jgi:hypothetical protein